MTGRNPRLSVVIPALDEETTLPHLLQDLSHLDRPIEIVVVDGGSGDRTVEVAVAGGARVVRAPRGRGRQLSAGAEAAAGRWLVFLHADCRLDAACREALERFVDADDAARFAHFGFALDVAPPLRRFIEFGQRLRERWFGMPYGDQGLIVSRGLYDASGGYPDWPIMEDVGLVDRLSAFGTRVALAPRMLTSGRRYASEGGVRAWLRNLGLVVLFRVGVGPDHLARWYRPNRHPRSRAAGAAEPRSVLVFAKPPVPGKAKTRLAADVGDDEAVRIYRALGRAVVDAVRGGPWKVVAWVDPCTDDALERVRAWFEPEGLIFRLQEGGTLGERMANALADALIDRGMACVVGTDIPGIDRATIAEVFRRLGTADVVIGPATDGGYYLIGMRRVEPALFQGIEWSTSSVLASTLASADALGLSVSLLEPLSDVDYLSDVPRHLMAR